LVGGEGETDGVIVRDGEAFVETEEPRLLASCKEEEAKVEDSCSIPGAPEGDVMLEKLEV